MTSEYFGAANRCVRRKGESVRRFRRMGRVSPACLVGLLTLSFRTGIVSAQTTPNSPMNGARILPTLVSNASGDAKAEAAEALLAPTARVQTIVDDVKERLSIPQEVVVSIVAQDKLLVSVERMPDRQGAFALAFERDFLEVLTNEELIAVVAHELGHVWMFTHHPYLQTEELANKVAMRLVSRYTLDSVYQKVWQRTGVVGELAYLPSK